MNLSEQAAKIELLLSDVDGVMTDGGVTFDNQGIESKQFYIRDGLGIKLWHRAGLKFGILTGRSSHVVQMRADELGIELVRQGVGDKLAAAQQVVDQLGIKPEAVCYIGDDLPDAPVMKYVGLGMAPADACEEVRQVADYVTTAAGGRGAIREAVRWLLTSQQRWDDLIKRYVL